MSGGWRRVLAAVIAAVLIGDIVGLATIDRGHYVRGAQLTKIEAFAEHARGLPLRRPVRPEFVSRAEFARVMSGNVPASQRAALARVETPFDTDAHAVGLLGHDQRLLAEEARVRELGALGAYNPQTNAMVIRSDARKLPAFVRVALAHEITHALQRQNLAIAPFPSEGNYGQTAVWHGLVEGDATRIQFRYFRTLTDSDKAEYEAFGRKNVSRVTALKLDPFVYQRTIADYSLGESMAIALAARGDLNDRLSHLPSSDIGELSPIALLARRAVTDPPIPAAARARDVVDRGHLGAVFWYLALASRLPLNEAISAMDGWNGDSFVTTRDTPNARPCMNAAFSATTGVLSVAFAHWRDAASPGSVTVSSDGTAVTVTSCEPAAPVHHVESFDRAIATLAARNALLMQANLAGMSGTRLDCLNRAYLDDLAAGTKHPRHYGGAVASGDAFLRRYAPRCSA